MTLAEALKIYHRCDLERSDCEDCPLQREEDIDAGDLGCITVDPCRLLTTAQMLLEKIPCP